MKNIFKKLSINQTIIFLSVFLFSLQAIYGVVTNYNINNMGHHITQIETQYIPLTKSITLITEEQLKQEILFERAFRITLATNENDSASKHFQEVKSAFLQLSNKIESELEHTIKMLEHDISVEEKEETKKEFSVMSEHIASIYEHHEIWSNEIKNIFQLFSNNDIHNVSKKAEVAEEHAVKLEESVVEVLAEIEEYTEKAIHRLSEEDNSIFVLGIVMLSISLLIAIILTKLIMANLTEDLDELKATITKISQGDLLTEISSKLGNEFGMDKMREQLKNTLLLVQSSADEMLGASNELAQVNIDIMENVNKQAEEIDLVAAAMTEMEATSVEVAHHAESTQSLTMLASQKANESRDITKKAMASMSDLTTSLDESSQNIQELEQHSANISSVLTVIKGIADQTNLLALNAAIEAARAGEQGRGFAVVADEVRTLAQRTQDSTIQIEEMVSLFTNGTTQAVTSMKVNSDYGRNSHYAAEESNQKIKDIQTSMEDINEMNSQIATAAEEQSCTSQELSKNTLMISKLSSENIGSFSQVSAASEQLYSLATQLKNNMEKFKLI